MYNKNKVKVIAMYLPQYHEVEENSKFWGDGYTDWVAVKKAKPLYDGHEQPRKPLNGYYDLSREEDIKMQIDMALKYGIYGFGIYHYWFSSDKVLMMKPAEILLEHKDWKMPFFFSWDNLSWRRTWSNIAGNDWAPLNDNMNNDCAQSGILIPYIIGNERDWKIHFDYLLPFFLDDRYIKVNGKPLFGIWHYSNDIRKMTEYWNRLAEQAGLPGIEILYTYQVKGEVDKRYPRFLYQPSHSTWALFNYRVKNKVRKILGMKDKVDTFNYDKAWKNLLKMAKKTTDSKIYHGAFVSYDDTPRRGLKGKNIIGATPQKFKNYIKELMKVEEEQNKEFIFLTAWNEWGEGAYLEPDEINGYAYLESLKAAIDECQAEK